MGEGPAQSEREGDDDGDTGGPGGPGGEGAYLQGSDKRFTLEAENAVRTEASTGKWNDLLGAGLSNDAAVKLEISVWGYNSAHQGPSLTWKLKAAHGGLYNVWLRTRSNDGDSVFTDMDGVVQDQHFSTLVSWTWHRLRHALVDLSAGGGEHTFTIWAREAGLEIDKVMLTPDGDSYTPSGEGPLESDRDGEPDSDGLDKPKSSGIYLQGADKVVSLEAESGKLSEQNGTWQSLDGSGFSGEKAMRASVTSRLPFGAGPKLAWTVKAAHSGEYKVWALIRNTGSNSVYTNLDGDSGYQYFADSASWGWRELWNRRVTLAAGGEHTFEIHARDPGVEIDKVVLLPISEPAPTGLGPAASAQQ